MTIATQSTKFTDNLREKRRYLQGRGVNLRMTIVDASADPYAAGDRIVVPGLHADDDIIGLINLDDMVDASGYLSEAGVKAFHEYLSSDARFTVTAAAAGTDGNLIYVQVARKGTSPSDETPLASQALSVAIGPYDQTLIQNGVDIDSAGHGGKTVILVMMATDASGTAITTDPDGPNSAKNVRAAILDAQEAMVQEAIVDVTIANGNGEDPVSATGPTALGDGVDPWFQGAVKASLVTDLDAYSPYGEIRYVAKTPGTAGNEITVEYVSGSPANGVVAVTVAAGDVVLTDPREIVVTYKSGTCTVQDAIDAVNAHAVAGALVLASLSSESAAQGDGSGLLSAMSETALSGGLDAGISLSVDAPVKLLVLWDTKEN